MSSGSESISFTNLSATPAAFTLKGGRYAMTVHATFGGGSVILKTLAADGLTWVPCDNVATSGTGFTADGNQQFDLAPGQYQLAITTATGVYAAVARIPL